MGQKISKKSPREKGSGKVPADIPQDSPLGIKLANWNIDPDTENKDQVKMIQYCMIEWTKEPIRPDHLYWPRYGPFEGWICQASNLYVNSKESSSPEESEYASCWKGEIWPKGVSTFKISEISREEKEKRWDPLEVLPPPYPLPPTNPPSPGKELTPSARGRSDRARRLRRKTSVKVKESEDQDTVQETPGVSLFPLREAPLGGAQGGIGFVNVPLTSTEVRNFKKELKGLLEDPIGLSEQLDQFLGPNVYTWEEMQSIISIIFSPKEQQMIRTAGMRIWERENQQGPPGDQKMPIVQPNWNQNDVEGCRNMSDYRNLIIKGIKEAAPRGQNVTKAFDGQQGREETPTEWLERLRGNMSQYSGTDPESPAGQTLLRVQFVTRAWPDIRRKLEKLEDWQDRGLNELLREAQKVYVRRDEEKAKAKAKIMVATMREGNIQKNPRVMGGVGRHPERREETFRRNQIPPRRGPSGTEKRNEGSGCFYCGKLGHFKKECPQRDKDQKMFRDTED
ncbi:programmed cell death protein 2 isoform 1-T2 [Alca torda]